MPSFLTTRKVAEEKRHISDVKSVVLGPVRYLRFSIFLSLIVIATGIFMPFVQVGVGGIALGSKTALPLYNAMSDLDMLQGMASKVEASPARRIADALLSRFGRDASQVSEYISDMRGAAQDIQDVREEAEIDTIASVVKIARNVLFGVLVLLAWLVLQSISQRTSNMRRAVATAIFMTLVGVFSTALFFGAGEGLDLANEEIGIDILSLGSGAYMMLVAAIIGTASAIAAAILEGRSREVTNN